MNIFQFRSVSCLSLPHHSYLFFGLQFILSLSLPLSLLSLILKIHNATPLSLSLSFLISILTNLLFKHRLYFRFFRLSIDIFLLSIPLFCSFISFTFAPLLCRIFLISLSHWITLPPLYSFLTITFLVHTGYFFVSLLPPSPFFFRYFSFSSSLLFPSFYLLHALLLILRVN